MQTPRLILPLALLTLFACCSTEDSTKTSSKPDGLPANQPAAQPAAPPAASLGAKVVETMDGGGYTYVNLETDGKQDWYAVPQCAVKVGDRVTVSPGAMAMQDFKSTTLGKTFEVIYFAQSLHPAGAADAGTAASDAAGVQAAHAKAKVPAAVVESGAVEKAEGGMTVAEICEQGSALAGKDVTLRGKVVKWNGGILGKNWLHVRDGSGTEGSNDITVTTEGEAKVGDTVLVKGKVAIDRDFGYGYVYALIIEDAKVVVE